MKSEGGKKRGREGIDKCMRKGKGEEECMGKEG